jgi:ubiquinone biosynthesis protein COQ4
MREMFRSTALLARTVWLRLTALVAGLRLLRDPNRLGDVFVLDRGFSREVASLVESLASQPGGRRALEERQRLALDLASLRVLPPGTFGRAVAEFYDENGLTPAAIPSLEASDDATFVQAHLYETHDVWHVAMGFGTSVSEELGLQAVYAAQMPGRLAPILIAGGLLQAALWVHDDFGARLSAVSRGYALGRRSRPLFGVHWENMWDAPIEEVRRRLVEPATEGDAPRDLGPCPA